MTSTSSERHGLAVARIYTSSPKGVFHSAMTVHGSAGSKLAGTVGSSEPQALWSISDAKAVILASQLHNWKAGKKPARPWEIAWPAGRIMQRRNLHQKIQNKRKNTVFVLSCALLGLHYLSTCARVKANMKICNNKTSSIPVCQRT